MSKIKKLGTFGGVFVPSVLSILGVIMYLRLPWIVGHAGLISTLSIVLVAHVISLATGLSISSIATDKKVEAGGMYYIISRSMGLPIGGTLGLALFVGLSFSISLYIIGFSEAFLNFLNLDTSINSIRLTGFIALSCVTIITFISTKLAIKTQYFILLAIVLSLVSIFFGNGEHAPSEPLISSFHESLPWIVLFGIFFPAVTGFGAGVSMSGDLTNPNKSLPRGTMAAILSGLAVYVFLVFYFAYFVDGEQLRENPNVLFDISRVKYFVVAGIWGATLSSALGSILAAPRILQAISKDKITPKVFAKGTGRLNEPRNALILAYLIALGGILIGELNAIARIVSIFFIITYGFINLSCFIESWASSDFRPAFKIHPIISITGALACFIVMIQLDLLAMIGATIILTSIFLYLQRKEMVLRSGDAWGSVWESIVKTGLLRLKKKKAETRNWRPNIILFSGGKQKRSYLLDLGVEMAGKLGVLTEFTVIDDEENLENAKKVQSVNIEGKYYSDLKIFQKKYFSTDLYKAFENIIQHYGFAGIEPNTILMGLPKEKSKYSQFINLNRIISQVDYNKVYLNYNKVKGFGNRKEIHLWWEGNGRNIVFAISLLRFLNTAFTWKRSVINFYYINNSSIPQESVYKILKNFIAQYRINVNLNVINNSIENKNSLTIIKEYSSGADLIIYDAPELFENLTVNNITSFKKHFDELPSSLIIESSNYFENISLFPQTKKITETDFAIENNKELVKTKVVTPQTKHIALNSQINTIAEKLEIIFSEFHNDLFEKINDQSRFVNHELYQIIDSSFNEIISLINSKDSLPKRNRLYYLWSQLLDKNISLTTDIINNELKSYEGFAQTSIEKLISDLDNFNNSLPEKLKLEFYKEDYVLDKEGNRKRRMFFGIKRILFKLGKKSVKETVPLRAAIRNRVNASMLNHVDKLLVEQQKNSLTSILELRKVLEQIKNNFYKLELDLIKENAKSDEFTKLKDELLELVQKNSEAEKAENRLAHNSLIRKLNIEISNLAKVVAEPGFKKLPKKQFFTDKERKQITDSILEYSDRWQFNVKYFINKIYADNLLQVVSLKIKSKVQKQYYDLLEKIRTTNIVVLENIINKIDVSLSETKEKSNPNLILNSATFTELHVSELFDDIYIQAKAFADELPEFVTIAAVSETETISKKEEKDKVAIINLQLRKNINYLLASQFTERFEKVISEYQNKINSKIRDINNNISITRYNIDKEHVQDSLSNESHKDNTLGVLKKLRQQILDDRKDLDNILEDFGVQISLTLKDIFENISNTSIYSSDVSIQSIKKRKTRRIKSRPFKILKNNIEKIIESLLYERSRGIIFAEKIQHDIKEHKSAVKQILEFVEEVMPKQEVLNRLPVYYKNLFNNKFTVDRRFRIDRPVERARATKAIEQFKNGSKGAIMIIGERNSGKTSLSNYIAQENFPRGCVFYLYPTREGSCKIEDFRKTLSKSTGIEGGVHEIFHKMPENSAIIINDIALWWERSKSGFDVIDLILELIKSYGKKCMFILNSNIVSYTFLNKYYNLNNHFQDVIRCEAFSTYEIRNMILSKHQAGGLRFKYGKTSESLMIEWRYAQLFNHYFNYSKGNPGTAINMWLSNITAVKENEIIITKPKKPNLSSFDIIDHDNIVILLQFLFHRRLSLTRLENLMNMPKSEISKKLEFLVSCKLLLSMSDNVYLLNTFVEPYLVNYLISKEIL